MKWSKKLKEEIRYLSDAEISKVIYDSITSLIKDTQKELPMYHIDFDMNIKVTEVGVDPLTATRELIQ